MSVMFLDYYTSVVVMSVLGLGERNFGEVQKQDVLCDSMAVLCRRLTPSLGNTYGVHPML